MRRQFTVEPGKSAPEDFSSVVSSALEGAHGERKNGIQQSIFYIDRRSVNVEVSEPSKLSLSRGDSKHFAVLAANVPCPSSTAGSSDDKRSSGSSIVVPVMIEMNTVQSREQFNKNPYKGILKTGSTEFDISNPPNYAQLQKENAQRIRIVPPPRENGKVATGQYVFDKELPSIRRSSIQTAGIGKPTRYSKFICLL